MLHKTTSIEAKFMQASLAKKGAGTTTKPRMLTTFRALAAHCKKGRYGDVTPENLSEKQWRKFALERASKVSERVAQLEMSHIRRALKGAGRGDFAKRMTNSELAVPKGTRIGDGRPVNPEVLSKALQAAAPDTAAWIKLERFLGLRQSEMIESHKTLASWARELEAGRAFIHVRDGTKNGRARDVLIPPQFRERALEAVRAGLAVLETRKYLVDTENKEAAKQQVHDRFSTLGLNGEDSGHSLRRAFAWDMYKHYRAEGETDKRALSLVSRDLGHGEGRGRWVWNNYLRNASDE